MPLEGDDEDPLLGNPRSLRIENAGGAWVGTLSGISTSASGEMLSAWFEGTGAYEGLSFFEWVGVPGGAYRGSR